MIICPSYNSSYPAWDYILGNHKMSICTQRYWYLYELASMNKTLKIAFKSLDNRWSKWTDFFKAPIHQLQMAYDIHRGLLDNEIVVESDYDDYYDNYDEIKNLGAYIESLGWKPQYYYSGSKSIHCLPTETQVFIKTRLGISKSTMGEIERLFKTNQHVEVMSPNGFVKVTHAIRRKQKKDEKLVRIYTYNGKRIDMSQNHLQVINRKSSLMVVKAKDIKSTDRLIYSLKSFDGIFNRHGFC